MNTNSYLGPSPQPRLNEFTFPLSVCCLTGLSQKTSLLQLVSSNQDLVKVHTMHLVNMSHKSLFISSGFPLPSLFSHAIYLLKKLGRMGLVGGSVG